MDRITALAQQCGKTYLVSNLRLLSRVAAKSWSFVDAGNWLGNILTDLRSPQNFRHAGLGSDLHATLREFHEVGVNWLCFLSSLGLGACLADDMGLGKTIQVLALLLVLKKKRGSVHLLNTQTHSAHIICS